MALPTIKSLISRLQGKAKTSPAGTFAAMSDWGELHFRYGRPVDYDQLYKAALIEPTANLAVYMPANDLAQVALRVYRRTQSNSTIAERIGLTKRRKMLRQWDRHGSRSVKAKISQIGEDIEEVTDPNDPVVALINSPNPRQTAFSYMRQLIVNRRTAGGVFEVPIVNGGRPVQLEMVAAKYMRAELDTEYNTLIREWVAHRNGRDHERYGTDEIIVYGTQNPDEPGKFVSALASCINEVYLLWNITTARTAMMANGGHPGGFIESTKGLNETQRRQLEAEFAKRFAGPESAGLPMVLEPGLIYKETARGKELDWNASIEALQDTVLRTMGIPNELLDTKDANLAGAQEASPEYARRTLLPIAREIEDERNERLIPMFGPGFEDYFLAFDDMVGEDMLAEVQVRQLKAQTYATVNEIRAEDGLEPIEGGDVVLGLQQAGASDPFGSLFGPPRQPMFSPPKPKPTEAEDEIVVTDVTDEQEQPVGAPIAEQALNGAQVQALREMALDVANGQLPAGAAAELMRSAFPSVPAERIQRIIEEMAGFVPRVEGEEPKLPPAKHKAKSDTITDIDAIFMGVEIPGCKCEGCRPPRKSKEADIDNETIYREHAAEVARRTEEWATDTYIDAIEQLQQGPMGTLSIAAFVEAAANRFLEDVSEPLVETFTAGYRDVADGDESLGQFAVTSDRAAELYRQHRIGLSRTIAATTLEQSQAMVDAVIEQGFDEGRRSDEISKLLAEKVPGLSRSRAETIARTEVSEALQKGRLEAWEDSEFIQGKRYLLSSDPCFICEYTARKWQGKVAGIREPFLEAGETIPNPAGGAYVVTRDVLTANCHPRCRCSMAQVDIDEGDE